MSRVRRRFRRISGDRPYRRLFVLATEGARTEPEYFRIFNQLGPVSVKCLSKPGGTDPLRVLRRMERHLKEERLRSSDQAWLVVDRDQWTEEQLVRLDDWAQKQQNHGFALSNPAFESWLLLHFEDTVDIASSQGCIRRLRQHLPDYDKSIPPGTFSREQIEEAIRRARARDTPPCKDWPRDPGGTTAYRLVEEILESCNDP